jgi:flagellar assembly protein FliH
MSLSKVVNPVGALATFANILRPIEDMADLGGGQNLHAQIKERAREEGFAQGHADGYEQGVAQGHSDAYRDAMAAHQAEIAAFAGRLQQIDQQIPVALQQWLDATTDQVVTVSVALATRILGETLTLEPTAIKAMVSQALHDVTSATEARVRVNPVDAEILERDIEALIAATPSLKSLTILRDASISAGCMVETEGGIVDARAEKMLFLALEALRRQG